MLNSNVRLKLKATKLRSSAFFQNQLEVSFYENAQSSYPRYVFVFFTVSKDIESIERKAYRNFFTFACRVFRAIALGIATAMQPLAAAAAESPPSFRFVSFRFDSIPICIEELQLFQIWIVKRSPIRGVLPSPEKLIV